MTDLAQLETAAEQRWLAQWLTGPTRTRYEELPPHMAAKVIEEVNSRK